ncbi:hypothetical protein IW261DRAFT_1567025 [Armillaria novae-zelandiae]|uniref:F-box domain-containing protein n=1 Tax=Armillaria novae-zelandiae TaxID=153914 RepID=A0AA39P2G8_9AGAR|nr:hypothetical protein IW261DRAFT_1567025 [Armillaria novae-zelandiae]
MNDIPDGLNSKCRESLLLPNDPSTFTIPSSLAYLLQTNEAPSESEVEDLKNSRERVGRSIAELDEKIHDLSDTPETLRLERARQQGIYAEYTTILAPIRRIPSETLYEIFSHAQEEYHRVFDMSSPSWVLSWVCSSWRSVVVNCSEFWCNLDVCPRRNMTGYGIPFLRTTIGRAGERKLVLWLHYKNRLASDSDIILLLHALMESSDRWLVVRLNCLPELLAAFTPIRGRLDSLEHLHICCDDSSLDIHIGAFEVAPRLKSVSMSGLKDTIVSLPPYRLLEFHDDRPLGGNTLNAYFLDIIRNAPDLHKFSVGHQNLGVNGVLGVVPRILHPNIHVLCACEDSFLRSLTLPQLEHASLAVGNTNYPCPEGSLTGLYDLLQNSYCSLRSLRIADPWSLESTLLDILQLTPPLEDFYIFTFCWGEQVNIIMQIISRMSDQDEEHNLRFLPALKSCDFNIKASEVPAHFTFFGTPLVDMIASRWNTVPIRGEKLRRIHMAVDRYTPVPEGLSLYNQSRLKAYKEEGLDISVADTDTVYV